MKNIKEEVKNEALRRMKLLKLHDEGAYTCVPQFRRFNKVWKSEFHGILYWLEEEEKKEVEAFEEKFKERDMLVYHCYKAHTEFGEILYMLFVSKDNNSQVEFDSDLKDGIIYCYAKNLSNPICSEFGSCYVKSMFGGIVIN